MNQLPEYYGTSPTDACQHQWQAYNAFPDSHFVGAYPTNDPNTYHCDWTSALNRCTGDCGTIQPAYTTLNCSAGYTAVGGICTPNEQITPPLPPGCSASDSGAGPGIGSAPNPPLSSPNVGNPIAIFDGAKLEQETDFETAGDKGRFFISRFYRSRPPSAVIARYREVRGAVGGWRFNFQTELHIPFNELTGWYTGAGVTLHLPNGLSLDFAQNGNSNSFVPFGTVQTRYSLQYIGTPPNDWRSITSTSTQWQVIDADENRVWTFQTFTQINQGVPFYIIARPSTMSVGQYVWNFNYDQYGTLQSISDSYGLSFAVAWNYFQYPNTSPANTNPVPVSIASITASTGASLVYTYDPPLQSGASIMNPGRLVQKQLVFGGNVLDSTTYQYENALFPTFLTGVTDARGVRYGTFAYDGLGRATSTQHAGGLDNYSIAYNQPSTTLPNDLVRYVTNPLGKIAEYHWTHPSNAYLSTLTKVVGQPSTNCGSTTRAWTYDSNYFVASETDEQGRVTAYVRDANNRPTKITRDPAGQAVVTNITWHPTLNLPTQIAAPGQTISATYNAGGLVTQIQQLDTTTQSVPYSTNGQTRTWGYGYNSTGQLTSVTDPAGSVTAYAYNANGGLQSVTDPVGNVTTITAWNLRRQPTSLTDPNGVVVNLAYEQTHGWLTKVTVDAAGTPAITTIAYDAVGDVTQITLPNGAYETYSYDGARRLMSVTNSAGETISYARNANGDITSTSISGSVGAGFAETRAFDELGRLIASIGAQSQTYNFAYDGTSNLVKVTDPRGNYFAYGFDALNRLIKETDESQAAVNLTRDGQDNITGYQDPRANVTSYVRNGFGEVIQEVSPDRGTTTYVRDARGLVTQKTDPRGIVTNYAYDNAGRLTGKNYPGQTPYAQSFIWDQHGTNNYGVGRLGTLSSESSQTVRQYDAKGRIASEVVANSTAPAVTVNYSYDAAGNITGMTYPSGHIFAFQRDAAGRISGITAQQTSASPVITVASGVSWNAYGPLYSLTFGNGLVSNFTLDSSYRVTRVQTGTAASPGATVDRSLSWIGDTVTAIVDNDNPGTTPPFTYGAQSQSFTYTPTRRLASASGYYGQYSWTYDGVGNRLTETANGVLSNYLYPGTSNQLQSVVTAGNGTRSLGYDAAGNVASDSNAAGSYNALNYSYDVEGRLSQSAAPLLLLNNGGRYGYDALDRLAWRVVAKPASSTTTLYVHDINNHIIAETDLSGVTWREYVWLNDLPVAVVDGVNTGAPKLYYVHTDHLGRPARMTAQNQGAVWDVIYAPFGAASYIWTNPETMDIRFPGQWFQLETGLAYNWHRHYDASLGRYIQPDPLGLDALLSDGPSVYGYGGSNPLVYTDASGQLLPILAWAVSGISYSAVSQIITNERRGFDHDKAVLCINLVQIGIDSFSWGLTGIAGAAWDIGFNFWNSRRFLLENFAPLKSALPGWMPANAAQKAAPYFSYTIADLIGEKCGCPQK